MSDNEEERNEDVHSMRDRILSILGADHGKKVDKIVFDLERLSDSKPALLVDYEVSFEKLERFAPPGLCIVEIAGKKIIVNLSMLDKRMPWGPEPQSRQTKPPIIVDISPGLPAPRILNSHDLPHSDGPDTVGSSNLYYMTEEICDMIRDIRLLIADGERVIEKRRQWSNVWCPATIWGCLLSLPVVFWSDSECELEKKTCLAHDAPVWEVEWIDGEAKRRLYAFCIPHNVMTTGLKAYLQRWTDSLTLPHQNCYMLQTKAGFNALAPFMM